MLAVAGLAAAVLAAVAFLALGALGALSWAASSLQLFVAPSLISVALAMFLGSHAVLPPRHVLASAIAAGVAWALTFLASRSLSTGFDEADAGVEQSWFGASFVAIAIAAWLAGSAAMTPLWATLLPRSHAGRPRRVAAILTSAACAAPLGLVVVNPIFALIGALVLVFFIQRGDAVRTESAGMARSRSSIGQKPASFTTRIVLIAVVVLGLGSITFAFSGSSLPGSTVDGTEAMNLGLAAAALLGIPLLVSAGSMNSRLPKRNSRGVVLAGVVSLTAGALGHLAGTDSAAQWPLLLVASLALGAGVGIGISAYLPGRTPSRYLLASGIGVAIAVSIGIPVAIGVGLLTPVLAVVLLVVTRPRAAPRGPAFR